MMKIYQRELSLLHNLLAIVRTLLLQLVVGLLLSFGCSKTPTEPAADLTQPWTEATPQSVGIDSAGLAQAVAKAEDTPRFQSLLVVRNKKLVLEEYFHGNFASNLNDVRSVTKSIVSTLTGIALKEGFIGSLDESIEKYLHPHIVQLTTAQKAITVHDLLTMTSGFQWNENSGPSYSDWILSGDHIQYLFDQPLVNTPGTTFVYNSAAVHVLGVVLSQATGMPLPQFADEYLFDRIGVQNRQWETLSGGFVNGGAGIDLRARDLARLGQLFLQNGIVNGQQILPGDWVAQATEPKFTWRTTFTPLRELTYGFLWWIEDRQGEEAYFAWGYGGQFIYVVPTLDLVVVATTNWRNVSSDGGPVPLEMATLDIIINDVVAAVE